MTYLILNAAFLGSLALVAISLRKRLSWRPIYLATIALLFATAIFDNLIVGTGIVAYDEKLILGIKIGYAPIEDFSYALAGPLLISIADYLIRGNRWKR
jgi:lycopene cyclase domain-containing protein